MLLVILSACSEYQVNGEKQPPGFETGDPVGLPPDIEVSPPNVSLGVVCEAGGSTVTVTNVGDGELDLDSLAVTGGWTADDSGLPAILAYGESLDIAVSGSGEGSLRLYSNDPDEGAVDVPLSSLPNSAPTISWVAPTSGATLPVGGVTDFRVARADDLDGPEALALSWSSDVDGVLSTAPAGGDGIASLVWDNTLRTPGTHTVRLTATDSCGATTEASIVVCQDRGYAADDLDLDTWHFEGSAIWDATYSWVQLTAPITDQSGTAFQTSTTATSDDVNITFLFYVSGGSGADGISLTVLDSTRMSGFVGSTGGGIGYMGLPGWSVEVDTWYNAEYNDPTDLDHVSFHIDGDVSNPLAWAVLPEMEDGAWHEMVVAVKGTHATVSVDGVSYIDGNFGQITSFPAYVGFTAGTGSYTNFHLIDSLLVTEYVCQE